MNQPTIQQLARALRGAWDEKTSFVPQEWSATNPARGQCLVSSLVVQDYYGGSLRRYDVTGKRFAETHYCNILDDGTIVDTTGCQYTDPVILEVTPINLGVHATARSKYLANSDTMVRYESLKKRVESILAG